MKNENIQIANARLFSEEAGAFLLTQKIEELKQKENRYGFNAIDNEIMQIYKNKIAEIDAFGLFGAMEVFNPNYFGHGNI